MPYLSMITVSLIQMFLITFDEITQFRQNILQIQNITIEMEETFLILRTNC